MLFYDSLFGYNNVIAFRVRSLLCSLLTALIKMKLSFQKRFKIHSGVFLFVFTLLANPVLGQATADTLWSFPTIRTDLNGDNIPDYLGEQVSVTGIVNVNSGLLHEHYLQVFIQNDSSGISLFSLQIDTPLFVGDSIRAWGVIDMYNGLIEVEADSYRVVQNVNLPPAGMLTDAILNPAKYLGMLVEGEGSIIEKGSTFNGKYVVIEPESGPGNMMVYVSNFHHHFSGFNFDVLSVGDKIAVKGIITEYNPDFPDEKNYKLFLRTPADLAFVGLPKYYIKLIFGGGIAILIITFVWIMVLRNRVDSKTKEIQFSLDQKDLLLKEIHHRVKNSLSIVSSLIELQIMSTDNKETIDILKNSQTRIQSVGLIHEKLYKSESLSSIELGAYIKDLAETIHATFTEYKEAVTLKFDLDKIELDTTRAIHCGLLVNELVINAFKHAFSKENQGKLSITLRKENNDIHLKLSDNGPGLPEDFNLDNGDNLGAMLIKSFISNMNGVMNISESREGGVSFEFKFPLHQNGRK